MNESIKQKIEELNNYFGAIEKFIDDIKWMAGGFTAAIITLFSLFSLSLNWNYNQDKNSLLEIKKDIKLELKNQKTFPKIDIISIENKPLHNQKIPISIEEEKLKKDMIGRYFIYIKHGIKNSGTEWTGPIFIKVYTKKPLELETPSIDEPDFQFEEHINPDNLNPSEIPSNYITTYFTKIYLKSNIKPSPEIIKNEHEILIKYYYGKGEVSSAKFIGFIEASERNAKTQLEISNPN